MAPPPAPDLTQRGRFGSLDSAMTASTVSSGLLNRDSFAAGYEGIIARGVGLAVGGDEEKEEVTTSTSTSTGHGKEDVNHVVEALRGSDVLGRKEKEEEEVEDREEEALRLALRGVWGLFSTGEEGRLEDRRRRFERVVQEVIRG
jgi:hypothetical protein